MYLICANMCTEPLVSSLKVKGNILIFSKVTKSNPIPRKMNRITEPNRQPLGTSCGFHLLFVSFDATLGTSKWSSYRVVQQQGSVAMSSLLKHLKAPGVSPHRCCMLQLSVMPCP